ncbi:hypothetical protein FS837_002241 [Tulasnella sp. UAMH 9824]|nr:hypothetical protein FS837_002241 [Tulasnella sp. UAMH 9824]
MWSLVDVHTNTDPAKIGHQIERAKSTCLDVRLLLDYKNFYHPYSEATFRAAIAAVAVKADQWGRLCIGGRFPGLKELYSWVPKTLSRLDSACVQATFDRDGEDWAPVLSTPSLKNLRVQGDAPFFFKDCAQLQKLRLTEITESWGDPDLEWQEEFYGFATCLSEHCPVLQSLSFEAAYVFIDYDDLIRRVPKPGAWRALASLNVLEFSYGTFPVIGFFLHHLSIPSPFTLELTGIELNSLLFSHHIKKFVENADKQPELLVEIVDTKTALGFSDWRDRPDDPEGEAREIIGEIQEDWDWLCLNAKVSWGFPGLPAKDRVSGIELREAIAFVLHSLLQDHWDDSPNGDRLTGLIHLARAMLLWIPEDAQ